MILLVEERKSQQIHIQFLFRYYIHPLKSNAVIMDEDDNCVRVAIRIRPQTPREIIDMCHVCTTVTPNEPQVTLGHDKSFTYNYVFDLDTDQAIIYDTCVAPLVDSSFEGYNATVFAYGQTGSGKTYTMGSGFDVELYQEQLGIIPRAIHHIFDGIRMRIEKAQESAMVPPEFKITAQFMELYNEEVIDLFNPVYTKDKTYKIHEDTYGGIQIRGISQRTVNSVEEAMQYLRLGALSRTTASTQMNTQSSRSHAIFTLYIRQQRMCNMQHSVDGSSSDPQQQQQQRPDNGADIETLTAKFHFVDLAGSERLKRTGATGERAREGISINCGLLALGNVISALGDRSKRALHIPYRDSKLTRLLQDSLGGNSQTVMIACVSPSDRDFMETLNTLKYANRAKNIKNKVCINQDKSSKTIGELRQQLAQLQLELIEYKQGKRVLGADGHEMINDMFYENNMLQGEVNNLKTRVKAMQDTIDSLTLKNSTLLVEKSMGTWIQTDSDNDVACMVQTYLKEIEELSAKLMESSNNCEQLRKQALKKTTSNDTAMIVKDSPLLSPFDDENYALIQEAKLELEKKRELLLVHRQQQQRSRQPSDASDDGEANDDLNIIDDGDDIQADLKDELLTLTNDIDTKQKLIDELELSQRRMQKMRQHYEDKLMQLQQRIRSTQEERDKVLRSYGCQNGSEQLAANSNERAKKIKDEYSRKLADMQKELNRLQIAHKEHARLIRNHSQYEAQLKSYKSELLEMKRAKVRLINKMKEETQKHKEAELRRIREIAQLKKETRKSANMIRNMEAERRIKDQVLKRKQEEVSVLRKNQREQYGNRLTLRQQQKRDLHGGSQPLFSERLAKQKWLKMEKCLNRIALNRKGLVEQEVRMEHFLEKREALGKELEALEERRQQLVRQNHQDMTQIDNYIDDVKENINYVQETITETQHNVIEIEDDAQDTNDSADLQLIVNGVYDVTEAKYLIQKLYAMTLSQCHAVSHRDAKLRETETTLCELQQENLVKGQLLDHVLANEIPIFAKEITTSWSSSNANDTSSNSSRSSSPIDPHHVREKHVQPRTKIRRRQAQPSELLFGLKTHQSCMTQSQYVNNIPGSMEKKHYHLQRVPSVPGSLKLNL